MTLNHVSALPTNVELIEGKRGGLYYMRNGHRVYVTKKPQPPNRKYRAPKRGAYARYLANIKEQ